MKLKVLKAITIKMAVFMARYVICQKCSDVLEESAQSVLKSGDSVAQEMVMVG